MKIRKEAVEHLKRRAALPDDDDPMYLINPQDAKTILEALGIVVRPGRAIDRLTTLVQTHGPTGNIYWTSLIISHLDAKDLLAYIEQLEENRK